MGTLNLDDLFSNIEEYLNRFQKHQSWIARKVERLEMVIIHKADHIDEETVATSAEVFATDQLRGKQRKAIQNDLVKVEPLSPEVPLDIVEVQFGSNENNKNRQNEQTSLDTEARLKVESEVRDFVAITSEDDFDSEVALENTTYPSPSSAPNLCDPIEEFGQMKNEDSNTDHKTIPEKRAVGRPKKTNSKKRPVGRPKRFAELEQLTQNNEGYYECPKCPNVFSQRTRVTAHFAALHTEVRDFLCKFCPMKFKKQADLNQHKDFFHNKGNGKHQCPDCDMQFTLSSR